MFNKGEKHSPSMPFYVSAECRRAELVAAAPWNGGRCQVAHRLEAWLPVASRRGERVNLPILPNGVEPQKTGGTT